ncbi:MAG TPA: nuclear transport factor 2 family protein [Rubrobacter sp.]|nr:nuclear transport factor 2 family protein [Rubrobacter sp.]
MKRPKGVNGLDFEALRLCIERCDPDQMLGFYADDVELSIGVDDSPQAQPFELHGRSEVAKHLRAAYGQKASHRVERVIVDEGRATFREACEYPDGSRVLVETTLEVRDGKIVRQVDSLVKDARAVAAAPTRLPGLERATNKEDH